jgi:LacI family transcriptional regulator
VIAYDEVPVAQYLAPPLTTVAMPLSELGAAGVEILVEVLDGSPARSQVLGSEPVLVERGSTVRLRSS